MSEYNHIGFISMPCTSLSNPRFSLGCCPIAQSPVPMNVLPDIQEEEKDTAMITQYDEIATQRRFIKDRAYSMFRNKIQALREEFYIDEDDFPSSPKEFVKRIQDGAYRIRKPDAVADDGTEQYFDRVTSYFEWRTKDPDHSGFKVARAKLDKEHNKLVDQITLKDPLESYELLEKWETADQTTQ